MSKKRKQCFIIELKKLLDKYDLKIEMYFQEIYFNNGESVCIESKNVGAGVEIIDVDMLSLKKMFEKEQ